MSKIEKITNKQAYWDLADKINEIIDYLKVLDEKCSHPLITLNAEKAERCPEDYELKHALAWLEPIENIETLTSDHKQAIGYLLKLAHSKLSKLSTSGITVNKIIDMIPDYIPEADYDAREKLAHAIMEALHKK